MYILHYLSASDNLTFINQRLCSTTTAQESLPIQPLISENLSLEGIDVQAKVALLEDLPSEGASESHFETASSGNLLLQIDALKDADSEEETPEGIGDEQTVQIRSHIRDGAFQVTENPLELLNLARDIPFEQLEKMQKLAEVMCWQQKARKAQNKAAYLGAMTKKIDEERHHNAKEKEIKYVELCLEVALKQGIHYEEAELQKLSAQLKKQQFLSDTEAHEERATIDMQLRRNAFHMERINRGLAEIDLKFKELDLERASSPRRRFNPLVQ